MDEKIDKAIDTAKGIILSRTQQDDMQKVAQAILNLAHVKALHVGSTKPTTEMDEELTYVLGRVRANLGASEIMQVTQAALHLMHAKQILISGKTATRTTKGTGT